MIASGRSGVRFANTHVAGERAVKLILDLAQMAVDESGPDAVKNWALDHCTHVNPDDLPRAARMGITFSCAPKYIMDATAATAQAYGDSAANNWVVPVKSMLDHGIRVAFESDRDMSVWYEIELLITRKDAKGKVWGPQERIDRTAALKTATIAAAEYILKGDQLGSIEPGKWADLVVLDRDYMTIPVEQIHEIQPQVTVFDGKIVFVHSQFAQEYNVRPAGAVISTYDELIARRPDTGGGGDSCSTGKRILNKPGSGAGLTGAGRRRPPVRRAPAIETKKQPGAESKSGRIQARSRRFRANRDFDRRPDRGCGKRVLFR
jgi:hypothetical protein